MTAPSTAPEPPLGQRTAPGPARTAPLTSATAEAWHLHPRAGIVQMVPAGHLYSRHIQPVGGSRDYTMWADPQPVPAPAGQWWPPPALTAAWLWENAPDVLHVHFGFETFTPDQLREAVAVMRAIGTALVLTVHDLHNPHFTDNTDHLAQLDVLVPAADEVLTLTDRAARTIRARWAREATVIPHPHVVPLTELPAARDAPAAPRRAPRAGDTVRIGVHAKDLRANVDPMAVLDGVEAAVARLAAAGMVATVRVDVREPVQDTARRQRLRAAYTERGFEVWEHGVLTDEELHADLRALDVTVLPYAFGTHSGWLEMCRDLGVPVAVPDVGCFAEQATTPAIRTFCPGAPEALAEAVVGLLQDAERIRPVSREGRGTQREQVAAAHRKVYAQALATARALATAASTS